MMPLRAGGIMPEMRETPEKTGTVVPRAKRATRKREGRAKIPSEASATPGMPFSSATVVHCTLSFLLTNASMATNAACHTMYASISRRDVVAMWKLSMENALFSNNMAPASLAGNADLSEAT